MATDIGNIPATSTTPADRYLTDAAAKLGVPRSQLQSTYKNWSGISRLLSATNSHGDGMYCTISSSGTFTTANDLGPGSVLRVSTGATAGGNTILYGPRFLPRPDTGKGYWRGRLKFETAVDAQANLGWYFYDSTGGAASMGVSIVGSISTANIIFQHSGNIAGSAVTLLGVNTSWHEYTVWFVGDGKIHTAVDDVEVGTGVTPSVPISVQLSEFVYANNNGTAATRTFSSKYSFMATTLD